MSGADSNRYELSPEDTHRMSRLTEEVRSRLLEMALITARTVGVRLTETSVVKFVPHSRTAELDAGARGDWMEIMEEEGVESCYGVIDGRAFAESPCGGGR